MRRLSVVLATLVTALVLAGCGSDRIDVTATFTDVGDLAVGAPVTMADIQVGEVKEVSLAGTEAVVTLALDPTAKVPEGVTVRVRRTSVLGERIVDIVLPENVSDSTPLLRDGDNIDDTVVRSDLEDLVSEGSDIFGAISAAQLAILIDEGGKGFGGNGPEIRNLLQNYGDIIKKYEDSSDVLVSLIHNLKGFNDTLAPHAAAHARSVVNTNKSIKVLSDESHRLEQAIVSLNRLARGGKGILEAHSDEMGAFFRQMKVILGVLNSEDSSLVQFLKWAPGHNYNTQAVEYSEFNQVVQQFVICGLNDDPSNPARTCNEGGK
ncbi:MAG: phospholipid/cholesterol/gamma-HCH transport system substrate-binding protein [Actinomycetota bacterium]|jgi:phospholipid/cholesterol/gamma-HCH transport system substrate-binding protein|nr:phospholipid/cholesterol/gamma-HCH transport system substrate-binding protein [Actinomycetota bacterium]